MRQEIQPVTETRAVNRTFWCDASSYPKGNGGAENSEKERSGVLHQPPKKKRWLSVGVQDHVHGALVSGRIHLHQEFALGNPRIGGCFR